MRLLHILEAMGGGTRRHVLDLLPALAARGHEVVLAVSPRRNWPEHETFLKDTAWLESQGVRVRCVEMPRGLTGGGAAVRSLAALMRQERPDVIHCHSTVAGALGRVARLVSVPRTPLVYTPHCIAFHTGLPRLQRRAARWIEVALAPLASRYIAVSHAEGLAIARVLHRRVSVVHNGVDLDAFDALRPARREDWGLSGEDLVIGCFGRLCAQKNQGALVAAMPAVLLRHPQAKVLLVGDGEDRTALEAQVGHRGLASQVLFAGEFPEARGLYALCDIVAQPSRWEGCPYTVLEGMAAAKPVVARAVGGVPELVDSTVGATYRCPSELAAAIVSAGDVGARKIAGIAGRSRVEERFALRSMVNGTLAAYSEVLMSRH